MGHVEIIKGEGNGGRCGGGEECLLGLNQKEHNLNGQVMGDEAFYLVEWRKPRWG